MGPKDAEVEFLVGRLPYNGAAEEAVLRSEIKNIHAAAYRTDVYEGAMLKTASPARMVHLQALVKQREFFQTECRRKLENGEAGGLGEKRQVPVSAKVAKQ